MADQAPTTINDASKTASRAGTASPIPAPQDKQATPATVSRGATASPKPAIQQPSPSATAPTEPSSNDASANTVHEEEDLPALGGESDADGDSALGGSDYTGGSTSIASSIRAGQWSGGRRYQVTRETEFNMPSDEKQFESMHSGHLAFSILESLRDNPFFRSPVPKTAQRILELGAGAGGWASDVADMFPNTTVYGVDLYPPPQDWVPPNCIFEVDDATKNWTWPHKFDFVHMRLFLGALSREGFKKIYKQAYDNLEPGGWLEHTEAELAVGSMAPKPLPENAMLRTWKTTLEAAALNAGNAPDITSWMREEIEAAGFVNIHEHDFKLPIGDWPQHPIYKEAGRLSKVHFMEGFTGWVSWGLQKFGAPTPWTEAEVTVWCALLRKEIEAGYSIYQTQKKVWAQKPFDAPKAQEQPAAESSEIAEA